MQNEPSEIAIVKAGFEFLGEPLKPWTPSRKVAAQSMGMLYPFIGESGSKQLDAAGHYPGMTKDIVILLWLCTVKDAADLTRDEVRAKVWTPSRALMNPSEAMLEAMAWAEINGVSDVYSKAYEEAVFIFPQIAAPPEAAQFKIEGSEPAPAQGDGPLV